MTSSAINTGSSVPQDVIDKTFDEIIHHIKVDHLLLQTNTADQMTRKFYESISLGDLDYLNRQSKTTANVHFMKRIIADYIAGLGSLKIEKIGLAFSDETLYAWIEINDDDEFTEHSLWALEAKINAVNFHNGVHISTLIVEKSDAIPMPSNYKNVKG